MKAGSRGCSVSKGKDSSAPEVFQNFELVQGGLNGKGQRLGR